MNILEIIEMRDRLKSELDTVERFLEIAKAHGANGAGANHSPMNVQAKNEAGANALNPNGLDKKKTDETDREYGAITNTVFNTIKGCPERFSVKHVSALLGQLGTPLENGQITTALRRLEQRGMIYLHRRGRGRKPTVYKKTTEKE